jgi:H+/Cl- antiporter ClcA
MSNTNAKSLLWIPLILMISLISGSASALFLFLLDTIGYFRNNHFNLIYLLPVSGLIITFIYNKWGEPILKGNNLIIEEIQVQDKVIPWFMGPIIFITTLLTHLVGGSAGREGTAVQMSASLNDQLSKLFKIDPINRKTLLLASVAAGFSSVFGTPLAGTVFALEFAWIGSINYISILPILLSSFGADFVTQTIWEIGHTQYFVFDIPPISIKTVLLTLIVGFIFGLTALFYSKLSKWLLNYAKILIPNAYYKILIGSMVLIFIFTLSHFIFNNDRFQGLGVAYIVKSFEQPAPFYDFFFKILITVLTLSIGFKGGEVTPIFFIGATLGSALSIYIPLPIALLTAMGFVAVFAGCARTPFACIIMGIELFGTATIPYISIACFIAYLIAKKEGIYTSQKSNFSH